MLQTEQRLTAAAGRDAYYLSLLAQCRAAEEDYLRIRAGLSAQDAQALERYISLCEELDHRLLSLALEQVLR